MQISITDIQPLLTGNKLAEAMKAVHAKRRALADGFLYEQTINMISADPGCGKSTISTQIAVELAAGLPVFGVFKVDKPLKVTYVQTERSIIEFLERLDTISKVYPIVKENLFVTDEYQKFNMLDPSHVELLIKCLKRDCPDADIIFFDPIYAMVSGGLSADLPACAFTHAMSRVQKEIGCALYYNHHTVKQQHDSRGEEISKKDPFYGSQWLKAHVTGSYYMSSSESGVNLTCKKDNYRILPAQISLYYDAETELCSIPITELPPIERVKSFIGVHKVSQREFSFNDIQASTKLCTRTLRALLMHSSIKDTIFVVSSIKNRNLYKVRTA